LRGDVGAFTVEEHEQLFRFGPHLRHQHVDALAHVDELEKVVGTQRIDVARVHRTRQAAVAIGGIFQQVDIAEDGVDTARRVLVHHADARLDPLARVTRLGDHHLKRDVEHVLQPVTVHFARLLLEELLGVGTLDALGFDFGEHDAVGELFEPVEPRVVPLVRQRLFELDERIRAHHGVGDRLDHETGFGEELQHLVVAQRVGIPGLAVLQLERAVVAQHEVRF